MGSHLPMPQRQWDRRRSRKGSMRCHPTASAPPTTLPNTFFSAGEIEAQGKESNFSKNAEQRQVSQSGGWRLPTHGILALCPFLGVHPCPRREREVDRAFS